MSVYGRVHGHGVTGTNKDGGADDDDWDTDPDYVNDVSEKEQRKGSKILHVDKDQVPQNMDAFRQHVISQDNQIRDKEYNEKKILYGGERAAKSQKD